MKTVVIIVAGGRGKRMGRPKQFLKIAGQADAGLDGGGLSAVAVIDGIVIVVAPGQMDLAQG